MYCKSLSNKESSKRRSTMTKRTLILVTVAAVAMLASAGGVRADVYFAENFENFEAGAAITSDTPTTSGGRWLVTSTATVVADPTGGTGKCLSNTVAGGDSSYLRIYPDAKISEPYALKFDAYFTPEGTGSTVYLTLKRVNDVKYNDEVYCNIMKNKDGSNGAAANYKAGDALSDHTGWFLPTGVWLSYEFTFPAAAPSESFTYSMKISNKTTGEVLWNATAIEAKRLNYETYRWDITGAAAGTHYIDNIQLAPIPEPMTMAAVGLGGLIVLARKRR